MVFSQRKLFPKNLLFQKSMNSFRYDHCTDIRFSAAMAHNVRIKTLYFSKTEKTTVKDFNFRFN